MPTETPELDKLHAATEAGSQAIGEFIEWLGTAGYVIARYEQPTYRIKPDWLVSDQDAKDGPLHRTISRRDPGLCGAEPKPYRRWSTVSGETTGGWYSAFEQYVELARPELVCAECERKFQAGEWPERQTLEPRLFPASRGIQALLAEYFEIDLDAVERERSAILESIRA